MSSLQLSVFIAIAAGALAILSIDNKEHPTKAKFAIAISVAIVIASIWLAVNENNKEQRQAESDAKKMEEEKRRLEEDSVSQRMTDERIMQIVETTSQILERSTGETLVIEDVLTDVSGEVTPEGLVIRYRLKSQLKHLEAIWYFDSFDSTFGPSFGDKIVIKGLPVEIGENSYIVSTDGMARGQKIPFEIRGSGPYVRAKYDVMLENGQRFKVDPSDIVSDKVVIK